MPTFLKSLYRLKFLLHHHVLKNITLRRAGQWALLFFLAYYWLRVIFFNDRFFNFEACCPFGGLQALTTYAVNSALACTMNGLQVVMGALLALAAIFLSKLFCGHVCPVGTISEGLGRLGKRWKLPKVELNGLWDIALRSIKYILLFITFYFTLQSNDLFCKKFDPFYATATLFGEDVSVWMGITSIALLIAGAIFLRQFWCRYLCPLGAISNAFKYVYVFIAFAALLFILRQANVELELTIWLAMITITAYALEIIGLKKKTSLQLLKVTRNTQTCIDCKLCDRACPQGIEVSKVEQVNHPDCNLCMECMGQCPHEESIGLNGSSKFRWLPTLITVVLIMAGFILGGNLSIPTVNKYWGEYKRTEDAAVYEMSGLKHVKCYGSSMTFVNKMKNIPGVVGTETFVKDHRVVIKYDSTKINAEQIRQRIFTPKHFDFRDAALTDEVYVMDVEIENFFDEMDAIFLANLFKDNENIYATKTIYGNPVKARFFTNGNVDSSYIRKTLEGSTLTYTTAEESFSSKDLYTVSAIHLIDQIVDGKYLKKLSFPAYKRAFNDRSKYTNDQLARTAIHISSYPKNQQFMHLIANYLAKSDYNIKGLIATYTNYGPVLIVFYAKGTDTNEESISNLLAKEKIIITYDDGVKKEMKNPYIFTVKKE